MVSLTEPQELKQATRIETKGGNWDYIIFHSFLTLLSILLNTVYAKNTGLEAKTGPVKIVKISQ